MSLLSWGNDDQSNIFEERNQRERLQKLEAFYRAVADLTVNHDTLVSGDEEYAVVYPNKLGKALEKVDPEWYNNT
jgi:hypothetical protein